MPSGEAPARSSAIRTFLIADIRGYTRFTDQFGDEAASRLATTFAEIVAEAMAAWNGQLVELRGDEALCTFDSPRAAIRGALELQQTFAEEAAATELPLHVGMGLDVGEAVPVGDGYRGAALNLAARLCAGAASGEIRATQNLAHVAGPIPGLLYEAQGTEQLKGVAAEVAIVRIRPTAEDATTPRATPPTGAERSTRPALPAQLESAVPLVGRGNDLLWLRWHWRRARHGHGATVEIVGPQGIGKTRLVAEAARLAHEDGAAVRTEAAGLETVDAPSLVVLDDHRGEPALDLSGAPVLVVLTGREAGARSQRPRRVLEPMVEADVAAIAALYAVDGAEGAPVGRILAESGGNPAAVHRLASHWARTAAMQRMSESARRTSRERRGLREAEVQLIGHYADLEHTREQARRFGGDGEAPVAGAGICPYKGLAAYEAADAEYYFGRELLIGELVARVVGSSFVGLVGASGSGKSSVLSAGLLPALASGVLPGSHDWIQAPMRPGTTPMRSLATALRRGLAPGDTDAAEPADLLERISDRMTPSQRLLLVIDQFEEVFSAADPERDAFIGCITETRPAVKVVLAVRADQYEKCALYPRLARLLAADQVLVGPLRSEEIAAIARHPAERVGLRVEPDLVEALIADLGTEPGAIPLLSTALLELWEARENGRLTLSAYRATGGVRGAVARLAESAYARLTDDEQEAARSLFMRLVGEGSEPDSIVRRRLPMSELETIGDTRVGDVVEQLTTGRLLTRDEGFVEVAHEALIREWPRLREWIEADAAGRQVRLHLISTAQAWDAGGRGDEDLYRGARLAGVLEWSAEHESELNAVERAFVDASRAGADRAADRQRRTNRILRGLLAGAGLLLVAAVGAGVIAFVQAGQNADNATASQVRELSLSALSLTAEDPELALLLASEAVEMSRAADRPPPPQALQALWSAYVAGKSIVAVPGVGARAVTYSPDGELLVVDAPEAPDLLVTVRDPSSGEEVDTIARNGEVGAVESVTFSPNGQWLTVTTVGSTGAGQGSVSVFDAATLERSHLLTSGHDGYLGATISDAGLVAASGTSGGQRLGEAMIWDLASGAERASISTVPGVAQSDLRYLHPLSVTLHPTSGQPVFGAISGFDNSLGFVITLNLPEGFLRCPSCPDLRPASLKSLDIYPDLVSLSRDGVRVAVADVARGQVTILDPLLGTPVFQPITYRNPRSMEWNADGTQLAVSGGEDAVVLDATTGSVLVRLPSRGESTLAAAFRAGSDEIATTSSAGGLRIHRTTATGGDIPTLGLQIARALVGGGEELRTGSHLVDVSVTAEHVVVSLADAGTAVFDRALGTELHSRAFEVDTRVHAPVAKDVGHVAGVYENGSTGVIEAATLRDAARLPGCTAPTGTSADGRYFVLDRSLLIGDACSNADAMAGIFDVTTGELAVEYGSERLVHGEISKPAGPGGQRFAAVAVYEDGSEVGRVDVWDLDTGELVVSVDEEVRPGFLPSTVSFSPDGRHLAIGTNGPIAIVLDVAALADGADLGEATQFDREVHTSRAPRVALTHDGVLATASGDGVYRFWDLETGEMTMQLETTGVLGTGAFDFSPDFDAFYYEDGGGIVRRMPVDVDEMIELAESLITRPLTDAECREHLHTDGCQSSERG